MWCPTGVYTLLFFIYINDLCLVSKLNSPIFFAGDATLFSSGKDRESLGSTTNKELLNIALWTKVDTLLFNI